MKAGFYFRYGTRSLRRGGNRTVLAGFCVGVGVMAIVGLQLAAAMVTTSLTANVRSANGGDISVVSVAVPFPASQLNLFKKLRHEGRITGYTAVRELSATLIRPNGQGLFITIDSVDPAHFPLVGNLPLKSGALGAFHQLITRPHTMVLSGSVASLLGVRVGQLVKVNVPGAGAAVRWTVGGTLSGSPPAGLSNDVLVSNAQLSGVLGAGVKTAYAAVYVTTKNSSDANRVASTVRNQMPLATVSTVKQALNSDKTASQSLTQFLSVAGLAALLIGGIGIINAMQVSLARRRLEIAMLKTTGYRRQDLYLLFGLEAALLGLMGGVAGAAAGIALSDAVRVLVQNFASVQISFVLSPEVILAGVGIGVATTCIFAILPIVRLSRVRPVAVLRDMPGGPTAGVVGSSLALLALVGALFWLLAAAILGSPWLAFWLVLGTGVALAVLTGIFSVALLVVGHLPVPERLSPSYVMLVGLALLVSIGIAALPSLRAVGALFIAAAMLGFIVVYVPRPVRSVIRLALRNAARQRTRTAATAVALFVGVFAVGLILVLGTDIRGDLDSFITKATTYNIIAVAPSKSAAPLLKAVATLHAKSELSTVAALASPVSINGRPFVQVGTSSPNRGRAQDAVSLLDGIQGYQVQDGVLPQVDITSGRQLRASDGASNGVLVSSALRAAPYRLNPGATIEVTNPFAEHPTTVALKVVGFYIPVVTKGKGIAFSTTVAPILGLTATAATVGGGSFDQVVEMKFPPDRADAAATQLRKADPSAEVVNLADFTLIIDQFLNNAILFLTAIASLALLAGIVIVANSVALSLMERRREIGVQKAVGLSNRAVYAQVLVETATVAWLGATFGMAAIALVLVPLGKLVLKVTLGIPTPLALALVLGAILVAVGTAALVAWRPVRVRPLEVLRYE
ncbi:MAG TPA: FtsX-like permease family protein [Candidatus Dormibacteraeota bacterium]|nr:FtsX-like permease family protein [Candidatus Dormibacteraeota bacterium]